MGGRLPEAGALAGQGGKGSVKSIHRPHLLGHGHAMHAKQRHTDGTRPRHSTLHGMPRMSRLGFRLP